METGPKKEGGEQIREDDSWLPSLGIMPKDTNAFSDVGTQGIFLHLLPC